MRYFFLSLLGLFHCISSVWAQPIGTWQEHLPYGSATGIATGPGKIFAATPYACFSVTGPENTIERFSRIQGLTETGVATIYATPNGTLIIAYQNSNIDLVTSSGTRNINALLLKQINGDKTVYQVNGDDEQCLLSTGFGVVELDLLKNELGDAWVIGNGGSYTKVYSTVRHAGYYYAATEEGLKKAPVTGANLADFRSWTQVSGAAGLPNGVTQQVILLKDTLYVQVGSVLFAEKNNLYHQVYADAATWINTTTSGDKILVCQQSPIPAVVVLFPDGKIAERITHPLISNPRKALYNEATLWIADSSNGLLEKTGSDISPVVPNSPAGIGTGSISAGNHEWWAATGDAISYFSGTSWSAYASKDHTIPFPFSKTGPVLMDRKGILWVGSNVDGLLKKENDQLANIKAGVLSPAYNDPQAYRVAGLASDAANNLWISNSGARDGLVVLSPTGSSKAFTIPFIYSNYAISQIVIDDLDQKWIVSTGGNGLFCFNHGAAIDNPADDQWRMYKAGRGNGNLPTNNVLCIAKDDYGFIWIGTDDGIGIIQCAGQVFSSQGCEALLPVVQSDQFAGYLFKGEAVQAIAVDGANRKWIGTKNGAWLLSADGEKTINRFTTVNSPLLNNDIRNIAIDPVDGTVIFSTASGLCSYKGEATQGGTTNTNVLVYPNPVPPGYNGPIAIRGLVNNATVKITEVNGRLVYQGRALGGQMIWNGQNLQGKTISTGVYLVMVSDDSRKEHVVTKIVFIQR